MPIYLGSHKLGDICKGSGSITRGYYGSTLVYEKPQPQPSLPPYTMRLLYKDGVTPTSRLGTLSQVSSSPNVWDVTYENSDWEFLLTYSTYSDLLEVLGANITGVTSMCGVFYKCTSLTNVALFDTRSVTNMAAMFEGCSSLTTVPLFDTSHVTFMNGIFRDCSSLTTVPLFDTSALTMMQNVFNGCSSLTTVPLFNTSAVCDTNSLFKGCTSLTSVPLFDTSSLQYAQEMFSGCTHLTSVPLFNTSSLVDMEGMFYNCYSLTTLPLFNTSSVVKMGSYGLYGLGAFQNCWVLTSLPLFDTHLVEDMTRAFMGCNRVQSGALALYQQASTQSNPPTHHQLAFTDCGAGTESGAAELAQIPQSWGGRMQ